MKKNQVLDEGKLNSQHTPTKSPKPSFELNLQTLDQIPQEKIEMPLTNGSMISPTETNEVEESTSSDTNGNLSSSDDHDVEQIKPSKRKLNRKTAENSLVRLDSSGDQTSSSDVGTKLIQPSEITQKYIITVDGCLTLFTAQWKGASVTIKGINNSKATPRSIRAFNYEIELLSQLNHPHIIQSFGYCVTSVSYQLVMESMPSDKLVDLALSKKLSEKTKLIYIRQILSVLVYLHLKNIVYRDLDPEKVLVDQKGSQVKLCDFGSAVQLEKGESELLSEEITGSVPYLAPEVLLGKPARFSSYSDMYSFGVLFWVVMTESLPWNKKSHYQIKEALRSKERLLLPPQKIPKKVASLIDFCWKNDLPQSESDESLDYRANAAEASKFFDKVILKST